VPYLHISSEASTQSQHFNNLSHHCTPSKPGTIPAITRLVFSNNQNLSSLEIEISISYFCYTFGNCHSTNVHSVTSRITRSRVHANQDIGPSDQNSSVEPMIKAEWKNRHSGSEFHISKHMFSLAPTPSFLPRADAKAATAARGWEGSACMQSIRDVLPPDTTCSGLEDAAR